MLHILHSEGALDAHYGGSDDEEWEEESWESDDGAEYADSSEGSEGHGAEERKRNDGIGYRGTLYTVPEEDGSPRGGGGSHAEELSHSLVQYRRALGY